jgi:hypothetical protein
MTMKYAVVLLLVLLTPYTAWGASKYVVDQMGSTPYRTIAQGLGAAQDGDTVKVLPGVYDEQVTLSKNVILMGSGFEATTIRSDTSPTVSVSSGIMMWFDISNGTGTGAEVSAGRLTNCVVRNCPVNGIVVSSNATGIISNCVVCGNNIGIATGGSNSATVYNCISWANRGVGFWSPYYTYFLRLSYCDGSTYSCSDGGGNINSDPLCRIPCVDVHISSSSPCWDTGRPDVLDPDGSRSDMGYFGGPYAPVFPVVTDVSLNPIEGGGVHITATGRANW